MNRELVYDLNTERCEAISKGEKEFQFPLRPGEFGIVPRSLNLEQVTEDQLSQIGKRFSDSKIRLRHFGSDVAQAEFKEIRYQKPELYAVYKITEVKGH